MEEKIIIQSKQYNIKKFCKIFCSLVIIISIIGTIGLYVGYCVMNNNISKSNYENHYVSERQKIIDEYNEIVERFDKEKDQYIECHHAKTTQSYYNGSYKTLLLPMTKDEFLENHPSYDRYMWCVYNLHNYESFEDYNGNPYEIGDTQKFEVAAPLFANLLIPLVILLYVRLRSYSLVITDKRVYGKAAFGKRVDLPLDSVSSVGTSSLKGIAVGTSSGSIKFKLIKNRNEVHNAISKLLADRQRPEKVLTKATIVESSNADELKKFKELLDMGAITQEEFDEKKKQLLNL